MNEDIRWLLKIVIGVVVCCAVAVVINHQLVAAYGQADGDLISFIVVPVGFTGIGMAIMLITGEV